MQSMIQSMTAWEYSFPRQARTYGWHFASSVLAISSIEGDNSPLLRPSRPASIHLSRKGAKSKPIKVLSVLPRGSSCRHLPSFTANLILSVRTPPLHIIRQFYIITQKKTFFNNFWKLAQDISVKNHSLTEKRNRKAIPQITEIFHSCNNTWYNQDHGHRKNRSKLDHRKYLV